MIKRILDKLLLPATLITLIVQLLTFKYDFRTFEEKTNSEILRLNNNITKLTNKNNLLEEKLNNKKENPTTIPEVAKEEKKVDTPKKEVADEKTAAPQSVKTGPVFDPYDISKLSNINSDEINSFLDESGLENLGKYYIEAESKYNVNAIFLMALTVLESAWGESEKALNQNNLSGYAVYDDYTKGATFDSKQENILDTAKLIREDYLNPDGVWHIGKSIWNINYKYSSDKLWASKIIEIANDLINKVKN